MQLVPFPRRVLSLLVSLALAAAVAAPAARASCSGSCDAELATTPKAVQAFVKGYWKATSACGKSAKIACPATCPAPDGTVAPYLLSASCSGLIACNLDALAATAYDTTWDGVAFCAIGPATTCGNARASNAGKLVSTKLSRRLASKMQAFAKDTAKCHAKIDAVSGCSSDVCDTAADWIDGILPITLKPSGYQTLPFSVANDGEGVATLTIATEGSDWGTAGAESVVVTYDLDGSAIGTIVLYGGGSPTIYRVLLGALTAGNHFIGLHHEKSLSPASKASVSVTAAADVEAIPSGDPRYDFTRFAPVLLGIDTSLNKQPPHPSNAVSDVPLIVYATAIPGSGLTTYRYTMIWSNEDGGTGIAPDVLNARYGRTTDIEGIAEADVSDTGTLLAVRYRPDESGALPTFTGSYQGGTHPILRTSTGNGLIGQDGQSTLHFNIAPVAYDDTGLPRELGMNFDLTSYVIMAKEMIREGKTESVGNPNTKKLSDASDYLYVDFNINVDLSGQVLRGVAVVNGITYYSDHNQSFSLALDPRETSGIGQLAIEVPPGTQLADVQQYGMQGIGTMSGTLASLRAFTLDSSYVPSAPITYTGPLNESGTNPFWLVTP